MIRGPSSWVLRLCLSALGIGNWNLAAYVEIMLFDFKLFKCEIPNTIISLYPTKFQFPNPNSQKKTDKALDVLPFWYMSMKLGIGP